MLAGLLVLVWIFVFYMMIRALCKRRLLWPGGVDGVREEAKFTAVKMVILIMIMYRAESVKRAVLKMLKERFSALVDYERQSTN